MESRHINTQSISLSLSEATVLKNTYLLLSGTLLFSAGCAWFALISNAQPLGFLTTIIGIFGLSYLTQALKNSAMGLIAIFAFTGFLGYTLGPMFNMIIASYTNGADIIFTALGATGIIFLALSAYVLTTRKNFSYMSGFLFSAMIIVFLLSLANLFFQFPILNILISGAFAMLSSALILYQTSAVINGGERNYIMATIQIFMALFNLFISLLNLLTIFAGSRD
jgi:modulator of FtsH protease